MKVINLERYIKNKRKQQEKKFLPKELIFLLFLILVFLSGLFYYKNEKYYQKLILEKKRLQKRWEDLRFSLDKKQNEMEMLLRREGIENYARQNYNYLKPGEILIMPFEKKNEVEFSNR